MSKQLELVSLGVSIATNRRSPKVRRAPKVSIILGRAAAIQNGIVSLYTTRMARPGALSNILPRLHQAASWKEKQQRLV